MLDGKAKMKGFFNSSFFSCFVELVTVVSVVVAILVHRDHHHCDDDTASCSVRILPSVEGFHYSAIPFRSIVTRRCRHPDSCRKSSTPSLSSSSASSLGTYWNNRNQYQHQHQHLMTDVVHCSGSSTSLASLPPSSSALQSSTTKDGDKDYTGDALKVGFLGCGTIASAIITGMATQTTIPIDSILVTKRSESKSSFLASTFPDVVSVVDHGEDNNQVLQEIVDRSDIVFLTVLPEQALDVLSQIQLDPNRHSLVSLVSTTKLPDLVAASNLDRSRVSKMICLPSIARHQGVTLLCSNSNSSGDANPSTTILQKLLDGMGGVVVSSSEQELEACMMTTCTMGPMYGMLRTSRDWLLDNTDSLSQQDASYLVIQQCIGALLDLDRPRPIKKRSKSDGDDGNTERKIHSDNVMGTSKDDPYRLEELIEEQTPGGLNEQALSNFVKLGGIQGQRKVMDAILSRIQGRSDGSVS